MKFNIELARCAQSNFENFEKAMPMLKGHPYWLVAKAQLDEALGGKTVEESLRPHLKKMEIKFENGKAVCDDENIASVMVDSGEDILQRP